MKRIFFYTFFCLSICLLYTLDTFSQCKGTWTSIGMEYKLQGSIKTWTMKNNKEVLRRKEFDKSGNLLSDTYSESPQTYVPVEFMPAKLKEELEKVYETTESSETDNMKTRYNKKNQLLEKSNKNYYLYNTFDDEGKILMSKTMTMTLETRAWNSNQHDEPTYSYMDTTGFLVLFQYNEADKLTKCEYFHSDPFQNFKMVYKYDEQNNMTEAWRYDNYNISVQDMPDHYIKEVMRRAKDNTFDIKTIYKNYWSIGSPVGEKHSYDALGRMTESISLRPNGEITYRVTFEYDDKGNKTKEVHYDTYHGTIRGEYYFDNKGNIVKETIYDYWQKSQCDFSYDIIYY